jgi:histidinol-phosphate aminotransferase 2
VPSALELLAESDAAGPRHPHLAVARTMSKAFGMAGLRLGYLAASRELVDALRVVRLPYHLSALTQAAALAALDHREELMGQVASLRSERDALVAWLRGRGCTAHESDANFVLFGPFEDRDAVFAALLERGVLIRVVGPEGYLRVSIGTPDEMEAFRSALDGVLAGTRPRAPRAAAERS